MNETLEDRLEAIKDSHQFYPKSTIPPRATLLEKWHCSLCGSTAVESAAWVDMNTGKVRTDEAAPSEFRCRHCGEFSDTVTTVTMDRNVRVTVTGSGKNHLEIAEATIAGHKATSS